MSWNFKTAMGFQGVKQELFYDHFNYQTQNYSLYVYWWQSLSLILQNAWSPWAHKKKKSKENRKSLPETYWAVGLIYLAYPERLRQLKLPDLRYIQIRGDKIDICEMLKTGSETWNLAQLWRDTATLTGPWKGLKGTYKEAGQGLPKLQR